MRCSYAIAHEMGQPAGFGRSSLHVREFIDPSEWHEIGLVAQCGYFPLSAPPCPNSVRSSPVRICFGPDDDFLFRYTAAYHVTNRFRSPQ